MQWKCKYCEFTSEKRGYLLKHYRLKHGSYTRTVPFPCLHQECLCTFKSISALRVHLSKIHQKDQDAQLCETLTFHCQSCDFSAACTEAVFITHLRSTHLKVNHRVHCPYNGCNFHTTVYSTFNAHRSKQHRTGNWKMFKPEIVSGSETNEVAEEEHGPPNNTVDLEGSEESSNEEHHDLGKQLEHNLAALFLKMQTILHIPQSSIDEVIQQLLHLSELSQPLLHNSVKDILKLHTDVDDSTVKQVVRAASESNIILKYCGKGGSLSTSKRRAAYVNKNFDVVMPVEYFIAREKKSSAVYVPINAMLQKMLNRADILDKALPVQKHVPHEYSTYRDGLYCKGNGLLNSEEFRIAVGLYTDDFEVSNPLGTSKKKHKMSAVYWVLANVPSKYRSTLQSIQLALLCKASDVKEYGYAKFLHPLIQDLVSLEQDGLYVEKLGACVKGTVLYVAADNLAAHSFAGFFESFGVDKFCRFCMATRSEIQDKEMAAHQKMTLRVIFTETDIRKVVLNTRPTTVEDLIGKLKESLGLNFNFSLQYQDPEFNYEVCNLTDIEDLPEKPTVKVIPLLELVSVSTSEEILSGTPSVADTEILSTSSQERQKQWPDCFDIPDFSVDVAYRLRQADLQFLRDGTHLKVTKELKHEILERLAESMYSYTAYPNNAQFESVAQALISKHPSLQERGSTSRCSGWKNSLKFKMANYRTKRRRSGCLDVAVNAGKRGGHSTEGEPANKNIKKAKKGEINFLPNFPDGFNQVALEGARKDLVNEMQKRTPNGQLVKEKMDLTFALRRKEVVESEPAVCEMVERWPALFTEDQVCMEFNRIVGKNLKQEFYESIDRHSPRLIEIFRSKRGNIGQMLTQLSQQTKTAEPTDIRTLVLRGLPVILGDNPTDFYKPAFDSDDDDSFRNIDIGILLVEPEGAVPSSSLHLSPASLKIVIEGEVVMDNIQDLPKAMCLLFGLAYAMHLSYPISMKFTFQFIQQVFLELGHVELKPKLQTLKNQLAM